MMKPSIYEVAELLVAKLNAGHYTRARISNAGLQRMANRPRLTPSFIVRMRDEMDDLGWAFVELPRGGFGLQSIHALDGAPFLPLEHEGATAA